MEKLKSVIRVDRELRADPGLEVEEMDAGRIRAVLEPVAAGLGAAAASGGTAPSQAGSDLYVGCTGGRDMDKKAKKAGDAKPDDDKPEPFNRGNDEYWHTNEED
ncbi:MAG: hypothetical protein MPJ05_08370 [Nitrosopumilus sp.]|nr:hypothetical protein [Nitrosopumilus sp.]